MKISIIEDLLTEEAFEELCGNMEEKVSAELESRSNGELQLKEYYSEEAVIARKDGKEMSEQNINIIKDIFESDCEIFKEKDNEIYIRFILSNMLTV